MSTIHREYSSVLVLAASLCSLLFSACSKDSKPAKAPTPNVVVTNAQTGPEIFQRCSVCHQLNAGGTPGVFPPLTGSEWTTGPARIPIRILLNGLSGHIVVEGKEFNNVMPAGGGIPMSDADIATILTYVRTQLGNSATPVSVAEVAAVRAETNTRTTPWTSEELEKLK